MKQRVALLAVCLGIAGVAPASAEPREAAPLVIVSDWLPSKPTRSPELFRQTVLVAHNQLRGELGVAPLQWNDSLAADALAYAQELAAEQRFVHAAAAERGPQGENLWMGTKRAFTYREMLSSWVDEGEAFKRGQFPAVSRTGSWHDVGHYTQMIWGGTRAVGCAIASNASDDYFVCRYWPAGNVLGADPLGG